MNVNDEWCESCEAPMSETGWFPASAASPMERREYRRVGTWLKVARIHDAYPRRVCADCYRLFIIQTPGRL